MRRSRDVDGAWYQRAAVAVLVLGIAPVTATAQERGEFQNLHVLPEGISRSELNQIMLDNLRGLGLPRRANEGCLFCHVGSMEIPASDWDWASDENPMKLKARTMMAMVREINETYLAGIERSWNDRVDCYTCHAARTNPMPLPELLLGEYETGGVEAVVRSYRELRSRYYAADAYDFRTPVLAGLAQAVAGRGAIEDAASIHRLNIEYTRDPRANQGLIQLRMLEVLDERGIEAMVDRYHALKAEHPPEAFDPLLLDPLAWRLFRSGREDAGFRLFELNYSEHPDSYVATEDLAWGNEAVGNHERAIQLAEAWLARHPGHELGQRLLRDLRGGG